MHLLQVGMYFHGQLQIVFLVFVFVFGTIIGSFLNVCITRIPEDISIVRPGSKCPKCGTPIKPYDNVPVFAWLWLRGKCRNCGQPISPMYPLVELATGLLFVACYLEFGLTQSLVKWLFFSCLIIILTVTDLRDRILPDVVTWPGFGLGLLFAAVLPPSDEASFLGAILSLRLLHVLPPQKALGLIDALLGGAFGSFMLWALAITYKKLRKEEGMGMGDVKLMATIGAFLGLRGTFFTVLVGSLLGSVIGIFTILSLYLGLWDSRLAVRARRRGVRMTRAVRWSIARKYPLPFGTFLGIAALVVMFLPMDFVVRLMLRR